VPRAPLPYLVLVHFPLLPRQVVLVGHDDERVVGRVLDVAVCDELADPAVEILKGRSLVEGERQEADVGAAVERRSETLEALLPRCVPNLRFQKKSYLSNFDVNCKFVIFGHVNIFFKKGFKEPNNGVRERERVVALAQQQS
jgi:hypothetical protein